MLTFGKRKCFHVFGCISKNFLENIFWCLEKKKENTNPEKHKPQPRSSPTTNPVRRPRRRSRSTARSRKASITISDLPLSDLAIEASRDRAVDRDLDPVRSRDGEIAINGAISRRRDRDQRRLECLPARSRSARTGARSSPAIVGLIGMFLLLSHAHALSLSLCKIFRKYFEGKIEV